MTTWQLTISEGKASYSLVGLRLLDELTNQPPISKVTACLDIQNSGGTWQATNIAGTWNSDAVLMYPDLERHAVVIGLSPRQYRVRLSADLYIPYYRLSADGIIFTAYPFNDTNPPAQVVKVPADTLLLPASNYPFAPNIPVLRGIVVDATGKVVRDVSVSQGNTERAITDNKGNFALPLRWAPSNVNVPIDASDQRTGRTGSINIQLPADLGKSHTISIS
jgi:hypothetical protein